MVGRCAIEKKDCPYSCFGYPSSSYSFVRFSGESVIGEITGAEWNILTIGETEYRQINGLDFTIADKGKYLGKAKYNGSAVRLYSVKGDTEDKYIYTFWYWEGFFYVRNE